MSKTPEEVIFKLAENYNFTETSLVKQLGLETPNHQLTTGTNREQIWLTLFERIIPKKFCIEQSVFIIDSHGSISKEVDLAIYDEQYTPYIFNYGKIKFIPIEAVAVAVQCKSQRNDGAYTWATSIRKLSTSMDSVVRTLPGLSVNALEQVYQKYKKEPDRKNQKSQTNTRPILILCTLADSVSKRMQKAFDIVLSINRENDTLNKCIHNEDKDLSWWYKILNHADYPEKANEKAKEMVRELRINQSPINRTLKQLRVYHNATPEEEYVTLSLTFQLNQLLMLINNPMFFPHISYVEMFNRTIDKFLAHSRKE